MFYESGIHPAVQRAGTPGAPSVTRIPLADGDAGIDQTAQVMVAVIRQAAADPAIKQLAVQITDGAGPVDRQEFARRLIYRVRNSYRYVPDTRDVEEIWGPSEHARRYLAYGYTWGDCDDLAVWLGALARAMGCAVRIHAIANGKRGNEFNHVFADVMTAPGVWRSMDFLSPRSPILREKMWDV